MRESNRLTALKVARLKRPGRYGDGRGLWLQVTPRGTKSWLFRYMLNGRARQMGLGPVHTVTLADARDRATACRRLLLDGIDPIDTRQADRVRAKIEAARSMTFKDCAISFIDANKPGWSNSKHLAQWRSSLERYVYPTIGDVSVTAIDTAMVLKVLEPIWTKKPETASRVRGRIEAVLDRAKALGYREGENPARWRGHLDKLLPATSKLTTVRHYPALPYRDIPAFMTDLRAQQGVSPRALEFTILSATRTSETINATWSEIDLDQKLWMIPADRMKGKREHRVPLCDHAVRLLAELPRDGDYVFMGGKADRPLSNMALLKVLARMGRSDLTTHGFRSTFRDWAAETTAYPAEVAEMALAHSVPDKVEAAYRRGDMFAKRRGLMDDWAKFCALVPRLAGDVVPIRAAVE